MVLLYGTNSEDEAGDDMPGAISEREADARIRQVVNEVKKMMGVPPSEKGKIYADRLPAAMYDDNIE